jgi:hypothetical protein
MTTTASAPAPVVPLPVVPQGDDNPHVLVARYRKARKLANTMVSEGFTADETASITHNEPARKLAAKLAGTNVPSEVTWALVVELVRERLER